MNGAKKVVLMLMLTALTALSAHAEHALVVSTDYPAAADGLELKLAANGDTFDRLAATPGDLSPYDQIWDLRVNDAISAADQTAYLAFLSAGGRVFLMGENSGFAARNNSILDFINLAGGGAGLSLTGECDNSAQTIQPPWNGSASTVTYPCSNNFVSTDLGTGTLMSINAGSNGSGLAFSPGTLSNATAGTLAVVLDVNFLMQTYWTDPSYAGTEEFTEALTGFIGGTIVAGPVTVPLFGPFGVLLLVVSFGWIGLRRLRA